MRVESKKPASRAGSLRNTCGTGLPHSSKPIEFLVIVRGDISRVWAAYQDRAEAFHTAQQLRRQGLDAEVKVTGQPMQLEFIF